MKNHALSFVTVYFHVALVKSASSPVPQQLRLAWRSVKRHASKILKKHLMKQRALHFVTVPWNALRQEVMKKHVLKYVLQMILFSRDVNLYASREESWMKNHVLPFAHASLTVEMWMQNPVLPFAHARLTVEMMRPAKNNAPRLELQARVKNYMSVLYTSETLESEEHDDEV